MKSILKSAALAVVTAAVMLANSATPVEVFSHAYNNRVLVSIVSPGGVVTEGEFVYARSADLTVDGFTFMVTWTDAQDGGRRWARAVMDVSAPGGWASTFIDTGAATNVKVEARPFRYTDGASVSER